MSEEEVIKILQHYLEIEEFDNAADFLVAIDKIIELYQKEKQKNERLIDRTIKYDTTLEHLQRDTIRKDKIKEVADNYESKGYIEIAGAMRELLEERNDK